MLIELIDGANADDVFSLSHMIDKITKQDTAIVKGVTGAFAPGKRSVRLPLALLSSHHIMILL
jgi:hypothetical protein